MSNPETVRKLSDASEGEIRQAIECALWRVQSEVGREDTELLRDCDTGSSHDHGFTLRLADGSEYEITMKRVR